MLGLGAIGPLAAKPVMEGKAVLFKKFADIDVFDIEINETDPDKLVDIIASLEPTFGGINLEDIKAPECFEVESKLKARMKIPVMHDDQHGTAIIVSAAMLNGLQVVGKKIDQVKLVASGAGAAALACLDLLVDLGMKVENITVTDIVGVVYEGRKELMDPRKARYAKKTNARTLADVIAGADIFLGLSAPRVLTPGHGQADGQGAADLRARQPDAGDPAGRGEGGAAGRHHRHRPLGLSEPGQQRPLLPLHLPRRARCRRDGDQRGDEDRLRARRSPIWPRRKPPTSSPTPMAARRRPSAATT